MFEQPNQKRNNTMSKTRIYEVTAHAQQAKIGDAPTGIGLAAKSYLVEAISAAAAERHVAAKYVGNAEVPNGKRIAELMGNGVKVEVTE